MIEKIYEISCDNCNHAINHIFYKPTIKDLKEDNIICYKGKQFCCEECLEEYKRAHKKSVDISIHIDNSIVQ
jgi:hypothetical protein